VIVEGFKKLDASSRLFRTFFRCCCIFLECYFDTSLYLARAILILGTTTRRASKPYRIFNIAAEIACWDGVVAEDSKRVVE
jgi:hypothetical protein